MGFVSSEQLNGQSGKRRRQGERNRSWEWRSVDSEQNFHTPQCFIVDDHASPARKSPIPPGTLPVHVHLGPDLLQHREGRVPGAQERMHHTMYVQIRTFGCTHPPNSRAIAQCEQVMTQRQGSKRPKRRDRAKMVVVRLSECRPRHKQTRRWSTFPYDSLHVMVMLDIHKGSPATIMIEATKHLAFGAWEQHFKRISVISEPIQYLTRVHF